MRDEPSDARGRPDAPVGARRHGEGAISAPPSDQEVTILFTDVEGSTALRGARGDEVADEILRAHEDIIRHNIVQYGGHEAKFLGDGFLADFPTPTATSCASPSSRAPYQAEDAAGPVRPV